jgi:hypothetical protein
MGKRQLLLSDTEIAFPHVSGSEKFPQHLSQIGHTLSPCVTRCYPRLGKCPLKRSAARVLPIGMYYRHTPDDYRACFLAFSAGGGEPLQHERRTDQGQQQGQEAG